ncbi:MAG: hypothetical protein AAB499_02165, partial [Patescibacteria group bacterium]
MKQLINRVVISLVALGLVWSSSVNLNARAQSEPPAVDSTANELAIAPNQPISRADFEVNEVGFWGRLWRRLGANLALSANSRLTAQREIVIDQLFLAKDDL